MTELSQSLRQRFAWASPFWGGARQTRGLDYSIARGIALLGARLASIGAQPLIQSARNAHVLLLTAFGAQPRVAQQQRITPSHLCIPNLRALEGLGGCPFDRNTPCV